MTQTTTEIVLPAIVDYSGYQIRQRPLPSPGNKQVLVQVDASGISFAEQSMRRGRYPGQPAFPFVPGYDFVGTVRAAGPNVDPNLVGKRVAAVTKIGGWATYVLAPADKLVVVPSDLDPALVETVLVNGITAWQMLHRRARVCAGQTIIVHGANGGVGTVLSQLAIHAGLRVLGTAAPRHHDALRSAGIEPVDYNPTGLEQRIRALAPDGVAAAFDHLGLKSARVSFRLLARGGSLICYGNAVLLNGSESMLGIFVRMLSQIAAWNLLPNGRRALFYNFWEGSRIAPKSFYTRLTADLHQLFARLADGTLHPPIAARLPLTEVAAAMQLAESRTLHGKVVLLPQAV